MHASINQSIKFSPNSLIHGQPTDVVDEQLSLRHKYRSELHSFANNTSNFFAEWDNTFQKLEEYFHNFLCHSQCNDYKHNTLLSLICY